ncbi:hypothetical protein BKA83DRAFT_1024812 [Pisolithus microcarpus]|nr:hypothetical protein BKA83DRAFT_1024812 [Pisolithus microcarpus]
MAYLRVKPTCRWPITMYSEHFNSVVTELFRPTGSGQGLKLLQITARMLTLCLASWRDAWRRQNSITQCRTPAYFAVGTISGVSLQPRDSPRNVGRSGVASHKVTPIGSCPRLHIPPHTESYTKTLYTKIATRRNDDLEKSFVLRFVKSSHLWGSRPFAKSIVVSRLNLCIGGHPLLLPNRSVSLW